MQLRDRVKELRRVKASDLLSHPKNWRRHPQPQRDALRTMLDRVGYVDAVIARETPGGLMLIDGHLRTGLTPDAEIPVLIVDLDESEAEEVLATLDPLAAMAEPDTERLKALVDGLAAKANEAMTDLLDQMHGLSEPDLPDEEPLTDEPEPRAKRGQVWQLVRHLLMCGDSTSAEDVARLLDGAKLKLIVTSPPYNQQIDKFTPSGMQKESGWVDKVRRMAYPDDMPEAGYQEWQKAVLSLWSSHLDDGGSWFYNHKHRYRDKRVVSPLEWLPGPLTLRQEIIWRHPSITLNARMFIPCEERIYWMYKGDDFYFDDATEIKSWSSVWDIAPSNDQFHAVSFPEEIPMRAIVACTRPDESVADPFVGSGTTIIAAERQNRACYAMEIDPRYVDMAIARWEQYTSGKAVCL